jgi:dTDP-4-amino-4,6-dideoxygalactose transaminase
VALEAAYRDGSWGKYHGHYVERLETALAEYQQLPFALTCASGTFAVELALRALRIGPGDEVILAAYDYPGNFLSVHAVGATPVLVDIDSSNWNLDPARLQTALSLRTRAVIASHLHGGVVPLRALMTLAESHGVRVIEDAAQCPGAVIEGRRAGTWGDVAVLSFGGSKLLTAGRGGALLTRHADIHQRARLALNRGNVVSPLSELQAAVLLPQLAKLDVYNTRRRDNVHHLLKRLGRLPGLRPFLNPGVGHAPAYYKLGFQFDAVEFGLARERFLAAVRAEGVALDEGFRGLHVGRSPKRFRQADPLTEATRAHSGAVVLHHPILLKEAAEVEQVVAAMRKVYVNANQLSEPEA